MQVALVVAKDGVLLGTITDGDVRRGLLRGLDLSSPAAAVLTQDPLFVLPELSRDSVLQLMRANSLHAIPVLDTTRRVVGLHLLDELLAPIQRQNLMAIMVGGQGSRLRPYTEERPKALLPVKGKPMVEHIIERARSEGVRHFLLAVHYRGQMIEDYFEDGSRWHVHIDYLREESPLGTAGALSLLNPRPENPLLVTNGDVLTDIRYGGLLDYHVRHGAAATMAVRLHEWENPFGVVRTKGVDIVDLEEKPTIRSHINAGVYVLGAAAFDVLKNGEPCDMPILFARLRERSARTIVYPMHEPWLDVGCVDDLEQARATTKSTTGL